jgi:hypothetical protein
MQWRILGYAMGDFGLLYAMGDFGLCNGGFGAMQWGILVWGLWYPTLLDIVLNCIPSDLLVFFFIIFCTGNTLHMRQDIIDISHISVSLQIASFKSILC